MESIALSVSENPYDPAQQLFREVILSLFKDAATTAIGLRLSLRFPGCGS
jgi:hypothetical protein